MIISPPLLTEVIPHVFSHWCPACVAVHLIKTNPLENQGKTHFFDGNYCAPTVSLQVRASHACRYYMSEGILHYDTTCNHDYAGKAIAMRPIPTWG